MTEQSALTEGQEQFRQTEEAFPLVRELYEKLTYDGLGADGFTRTLEDLKQRFPKLDVWKRFNGYEKAHGPRITYANSGAGLVLCVNGRLEPTPEQAEVILRNYRSSVECMPDNMREIHEFVTAFAED